VLRRFAESLTTFSNRTKAEPPRERRVRAV
jgi:hypothetical protein